MATSQRRISFGPPAAEHRRVDQLCGAAEPRVEANDEDVRAPAARNEAAGRGRKVDRTRRAEHGDDRDREIVVLQMEPEVEPGDRVLEIGTGSGYQAAILAGVGARVFSVEIVEELADPPTDLQDPLRRRRLALQVEHAAQVFGQGQTLLHIDVFRKISANP